MKDVVPGDSVHSLLSILDIITVSPSFTLLLVPGSWFQMFQMFQMFPPHCAFE